MRYPSPPAAVADVFFFSGETMRNGAINIAIKVARHAGQLIIRQLPRRDSIPVHEKANMDFATEVDTAVEREIQRDLKRAFPDHAFLGEETGQTGKSPYLWVVDPLDGTSNFIHGIPHFSVSIALLDRGEPILGVVFDPLRDELFSAEKGRGALLNDRRLRVGQRRELNSALLLTGFAPRVRDQLATQLAITGEFLANAEDIRRSGSAALDLAWIACGRADGYYETGVKPWDVAAGTLLVREAGGQVTDYRGGNDFMQTGQIVAANMHLAEVMRKTLSAHAD